METLIKADIFFFISSITTIVIAILASVLLYYLIKAGKNLSALSEALKDNFRESGEYVSELKDRLEENIIFRLLFPPAKRKRKNAPRDDQSA